MALSPDQTAVLEFLLGGQTYAELAELLGLDEADVRRRARSALAELGGADPDRAVGLTDYLLGKADPIGRADAVRHLRQDADDHALAERILAGLRELAPQADLPRLPATPGAGRFMRGAPGVERRDSRAGALPSRRGRMIAMLSGAAVILVFVVLAITGVFSGEEEAPLGAETPSENDDGSLQVPGTELERIRLASVGAGDAQGEGIVGLTDSDQPYIDLTLSNLEPAPNEQVYVVWFLFDEETGYPLAPIEPDRTGSFEQRFPIPSAAIPVLGRIRFLNVSLAPQRTVLRTIQDALEEGTLVIRKSGETVLQNRKPLPASQATNGGEPSP